MINVHDVSYYGGSGAGNDLVYRLKRLSLVQDRRKDAPKSSHEYRFGQPVLNPQPKEVLWREGKFLARKHFSLFLEGNASARTRKTAEIFEKK
jgi:hypothetical protein